LQNPVAEYGQRKVLLKKKTLFRLSDYPNPSSFINRTGGVGRGLAKWLLSEGLVEIRPGERGGAQLRPGYKWLIQNKTPNQRSYAIFSH